MINNVYIKAGGGGAKFTNAGGLAGKNILLGVPNNWTIADGGGI